MTPPQMHVGSDWDCDSDNDLKVLGRGVTPTEELIASGLPAEMHEQLCYRNVTADEAKELTGFNMEGWVVPYCDQDGHAYQHDGKDFYRLKPDHPGKGPKYLSSKEAGCRPYWSPLFGERYHAKGKPWFITEGRRKLIALTTMASQPSDYLASVVGRTNDQVSLSHSPSWWLSTGGARSTSSSTLI